MTKEVFLNDQGIIEVHPAGKLVESDVKRFSDAIGVLIDECRGQGRPALVLDILFQMTDITVPARAAMVECFKSMDFDKLAMVGSGTFLNLGANLVIRAVGKESAMEYFEDTDAAAAWLLGK